MIRVRKEESEERMFRVSETTFLVPSSARNGIAIVVVIMAKTIKRSRVFFIASSDQMPAP